MVIFKSKEVKTMHDSPWSVVIVKKGPLTGIFDYSPDIKELGQTVFVLSVIW